MFLYPASSLYPLSIYCLSPAPSVYEFYTFSRFLSQKHKTQNRLASADDVMDGASVITGGRPRAAKSLASACHVVLPMYRSKYEWIGSGTSTVALPNVTGPSIIASVEYTRSKYG